MTSSNGCRPRTFYSDGSRTRKVYLPIGASWRNAWTDEQQDGGTEIQTEAPLQRIPVYIRDD
ncbi:MAG: hypothetical protein E4H02_03650, partial [Lentisphaerales bacterium]